MDQFREDIRYSWRSIRRTSAFTLTAVLMLAVAIGLNVTALSVVDASLFFRPDGVADVERLVRVPNSWMRYDQYLKLSQDLRALPLAAQSGVTPVSIGSGVATELVQARYVTSNYFSLLGVRPALGRVFLPGDDLGAASTVVLGHRFWNRQFGGDPGAVGKAMRVSGEIHTIVGVAPPGFTGVDRQVVDVWLPAAPARHIPGGLWLIGRLGEGVSLRQAQAAVLLRYPPDIPRLGDGSGRPARVLLTPVYEDLATRLLQLNLFVVCVLGASTLLVSIACANLAGLLLNRAFHQRRDLVLRMQLGASRARIIRQLLIEVLLLNTVAALVLLCQIAESAPDSAVI